jgi:hypothetical protein
MSRGDMFHFVLVCPRRCRSRAPQSQDRRPAQHTAALAARLSRRPQAIISPLAFSGSESVWQQIQWSVRRV